MKKRLYKVLIALSMTMIIFGVSACGNESSETFPTETENTEETEKESEEETETTEEESTAETTKESESETESDEEKESESEESRKESSTKESDTKSESSSESTKSTPQTTTAPPTPESHTHSYVESVISNPTCVSEGQKQFVCSCGDSYTENLGTVAHNFTEAVYGTVHHDEVWQNVPRQTSARRVVQCGCGAQFTTQAEFDAHRIASFEVNGPFCVCAGPYNIIDYPGETVYDYVKVSDAYDEQVVVAYKCSVCGQQQ